MMEPSTPNKKTETKINNSKQTYEKPMLRAIRLETDQVLGIGCKMEAAGSAIGVPASCVGNFCAEVGS